MNQFISGMYWIICSMVALSNHWQLYTFSQAKGPVFSRIISPHLRNIGEYSVESRVEVFRDCIGQGEEQRLCLIRTGDSTDA